MYQRIRDGMHHFKSNQDNLFYTDNIAHWDEDTNVAWHNRQALNIENIAPTLSHSHYNNHRCIQQSYGKLSRNMFSIDALYVLEMIYSESY